MSVRNSRPHGTACAPVREPVAPGRQGFKLLAALSLSLQDSKTSLRQEIRVHTIIERILHKTPCAHHCHSAIEKSVSLQYNI